MFISIGKIVNTHGVNGEVKVKVYSDSLDRFEGMRQIYAVSGEEEKAGGRAAEAYADGQAKAPADEEPGDRAKDRRLLNISGLRYHKDMVLMSFREITDMTAAEKLKNSYLQVRESELPPLPAGRYYIYQLEGLTVWEKGVCYGTLTEVMQPGSNDVYAVRDGRREILIPALKTVIKEVDLEKGRMEVELPAGLLELYP